VSNDENANPRRVYNMGLRTVLLFI